MKEVKRKQKEEKKLNIEKSLNKVVSWAVLIPTIGLILFMFVQSFAGIIHLTQELFQIVSTSNYENLHHQSIVWLQTVATIVILVKAYKVLISYVKTHHLSIKYLLEISFTAHY